LPLFRYKKNGWKYISVSVILIYEIKSILEIYWEYMKITENFSELLYDIPYQLKAPAAVDASL
jgi:hypothetical protein